MPFIEDCWRACFEKGTATWMSIGVTGCECGTADSAVVEDGLDWKIASQPESDQGYPAARGFVLMSKKEGTRNFVPHKFTWIQTALNTGKRAELEDKPVTKWVPGALGSKMEEKVEKLHGDVKFEELKNITNLGSQDRREVETKRTRTLSGKHTEDTHNEDGFLKRATLRVKGKGYITTSVLFRLYEMSPSARKASENITTICSLKTAKEHDMLFRDCNASTARRNDDWRQTNETSAGHIFYIRPSLFGECFTGTANETGWVDSGTKADTLNECICACRRSKLAKNVTAFILQSGHCICSALSTSMGTLIGRVPLPATCPADAARQAYVGSDHLGQLCGPFKGKDVIGPGQAGMHGVSTTHHFLHRSTQGYAFGVKKLQISTMDHSATLERALTVVGHIKHGASHTLSLALLNRSKYLCFNERIYV
ncbi:uncharacterized protein LOC119102696 [Pollicipes pollicipes]|uniref:uncharacterized protein LOC119102696 n=1 Tax=Pollicipes pollicipes TaxID=41117 RepID=UPI0018853704|nr:uncharacterized protein LOC119102696 [Pollicipes pollicipes]